MLTSCFARQPSQRERKAVRRIGLTPTNSSAMANEFIAPFVMFSPSMRLSQLTVMHGLMGCVNLLSQSTAFLTWVEVLRLLVSTAHQVRSCANWI
jgi:hypothetical protein